LSARPLVLCVFLVFLPARASPLVRCSTTPQVFAPFGEKTSPLKFFSFSAGRCIRVHPCILPSFFSVPVSGHSIFLRLYDATTPVGPVVRSFFSLSLPPRLMYVPRQFCRERIFPGFFSLGHRRRLETQEALRFFPLVGGGPMPRSCPPIFFFFFSWRSAQRAARSCRERSPPSDRRCQHQPNPPTPQDGPFLPLRRFGIVPRLRLGSAHPPNGKFFFEYDPPDFFYCGSQNDPFCILFGDAVARLPRPQFPPPLLSEPLFFFAGPDVLGFLPLSAFPIMPLFPPSFSPPFCRAFPLFSATRRGPVPFLTFSDAFSPPSPHGFHNDTALL